LSESIRLGGLVFRSFDLEGNLIGLLARGIPWKRAILVLVFGAQATTRPGAIHQCFLDLPIHGRPIARLLFGDNDSPFTM